MPNLKICPDCQHKVSPSAKSCLNCGRLNPGGSAPMDSVWQVTVVGAVIAGAFWFFGSITAAINSPTYQGFEQLEQSAQETAKAARCASQPTSADCD